MRLTRIVTLIGAFCAAAQTAHATPPLQNKHEVTMYSAPWCAPCRKAERWFQCIGQPVDHRDIEKDVTSGQRYKQLKGWSLPLLFVDGVRMDGFQEKLLIDLLGKGEAQPVRDHLLACIHG